MKGRKLLMIPVSEEISANTHLAPYYTDGVKGADFMKAKGASDVILAGRLFPGIKDTYFRVGHMRSVANGDILTTVAAIEGAFLACCYSSTRLSSGLR